MKRDVLILGFLLILVGVAFAIRSNTLMNKTTLTWEFAKTEVFTLEISANFTAGDIVKLEIYPNHDWQQEPEVDDVPYPHIFVYVNVTSPREDQSYYEIAYVSYRFYQAILKAPGGFSGEYGNETLNAERAIVGKVMYDGQYTARIVGVIIPAGEAKADALNFYKGIENIETTYPYRNELPIAIIILVAGGGISIWGIKSGKRPIKGKKRSHTR